MVKEIENYGPSPMTVLENSSSFETQAFSLSHFYSFLYVWRMHRCEHTLQQTPFHNWNATILNVSFAEIAIQITPPLKCLTRAINEYNKRWGALTLYIGW